MKKMLASLSHQALFGLLLIVASLLYFYFDYTLWLVGITQVMFLLGNILFFNAVSGKFHGTQITTRNVYALFATGVMFSLLFELYVHWWGKFWYYPLLSTETYLILLIPFYCLYIIYLLTAYFSILAVLRHLYKPKKVASHNLKIVTRIARVIGITGGVGVIASTFILAFYFTAPHLEQFLSINYASRVDPIMLPLMVIVGLSFWLLFEYLDYKKNRNKGLLIGAIYKDYLPLVAIVLAGLLLAITYESFNTPSGWWRYANIPFSEIHLFGVPALIYLLWPLQYLPIIALYKLLQPKNSRFPEKTYSDHYYNNKP